MKTQCHDVTLGNARDLGKRAAEVASNLGGQSMNDAHEKSRLFIANCSLVLFIAGLLVPFIIAALGLLFDGPKETYHLAFGFGVIAELLALLLGNAASQHLSGKVGKYGAMSIFGLVLVLFLASLLVFVFGSSGEMATPPSPVIAEPQQPEPQPSGEERIP